MILPVFFTNKPHPGSSFFIYFFFQFGFFDGGSLFRMQNILGGWRRNLMRKTIRASIFRLLFTCSEILFLSAAEAQLMGFLPKKSFCQHVSRGALRSLRILSPFPNGHWNFAILYFPKEKCNWNGVGNSPKTILQLYCC